MAGELLRTLTHELRNALAPIVNAVHLLRMRGAGPEHADTLSIIERQIAAITRILDAASDGDRLARGEAEIAAPRVAPEAASSARAASGTRRILVADDNQAVRNSFAAILREMGHDVRLAADGVQTVEVAEAWSPEFVIVDVHMPKIDGYAVARKLRARFSPDQMQLVMMSGTDLDPMTVLGAKQAGFDHCVDKTLAVNGLDALLRGEAPSRHA